MRPISGDLESKYEVLIIPVTYLVVGYLKRVEGIDTFDYSTRFNPFAINE